MNTEQQLTKEIEELENQILPLKDKLSEIRKKKDTIIQKRIKLADQGKGDFTLEELRFAATSKCCCGAGLAYPKDYMDIHGSWDCSAILLGRAEKGTSHDEGFPFTFYEIKSENQPSANALSTRPEK